MEESIKDTDLSLLSQIHKEFGGCKTELRTYSPLTFAYIGDAVFEIIIRTLIVEKGQRAANMLHKHTIQIVCAQTQARMAEAVEPLMAEKERDIYRRGKNTKTNSSAKNASLSDYRKATGFEALCGYLFLNGETARIVELVKAALELLELEL